jgi:hypothetical protein
MQSQMYTPQTTIPSIAPPTYGHPPPQQQVFTPIQQQMYQPGPQQVYPTQPTFQHSEPKLPPYQIPRTNTSVSRFKNIRCFHCQKLGHGYTVCRSASEADKERILYRLSQQPKRGMHSQNSAFPRQTETENHLNLNAAIPDPQQSPQ